MKKSVPLICFFLLTFFNSGCGRKGQLQEPVPRAPQVVSDFKVVQRGDCLIFTWTPPASYLSGAPLEISAAEILGMEIKEGTTSGKNEAETFRRYSRPLTRLEVGRLETGLNRAVLRLEMEKTAGKNYLFGLRTRGKKGGWAELSNLVAVKTEILPPPPSGLKAEVGEYGINLSWNPPATNPEGLTPPEKIFYNLYRSEDGEFKLLNNQPLAEPRFEDRSFAFGLTYRYLVRSAVSRGGGFKESSDSEILEVRALDVFPPARPEEVKALSGTDGVTISWLPNQEKDLSGYRVYRLKEGEPGEPAQVLLTPDNLTVPVFLDRSVEKKASYVYSICAVDRSGNESPPARIKVTT